jgi:hypothetical protein
VLKSFSDFGNAELFWTEIEEVQKVVEKVRTRDVSLQVAAFQLGVGVDELRRRVGNIISSREKLELVESRKAQVQNPLQVSSSLKIMTNQLI